MDKALRKQVQRAKRKMTKAGVLAFANTPEARKASKEMSNLWADRMPSSVKGFWVGSHAKI